MTSPISPELQSKIASWRLRATTGELTQEEMKEAIAFLRAGRITAAAQSATAKRKAAAKAIPHADDLLNELDSL